MPETSRGRAKKVVAPRGKGRRSQAEREQISQQEKERTREREAQYAKEQARLARQRAEEERRSQSRRGDRGRGRGGYMGETRLASGPFSGGSVIGTNIARGRAFPRPWAPSNASGLSTSRRLSRGSSYAIGDGVDPVKREDGLKNENSDADMLMLFGGDIKREIQDGGYISSDPDEATQGKRKDIDYIDLISDDEDNADKNGESESGPKDRINSPFMAPIRIHRVEHRDRAPPVTQEAGADTRIKQQEDDDDVVMSDIPTSSVKKGKQRAKDVEVVGERRWRGVYEDEEDLVYVKDEPADEAEESSALPEKLNDSPEAKQKRQHKPSSKNIAPVLNTEEERAEHDRYEQDITLLIQELGSIGTGTDNDTAATDGASSSLFVPTDQRADRVYLFQLPPVVPNLSIKQPTVIKDEPTESRSNPIVASDSASTNVQQSRDPPVTIKIEDNGKSKGKSEPSRPAHLPTLDSGTPGKLRVYKSGKVTLNWGGTSLQIQKGMDSGFLQDIVMVRLNEDQQGSSGSGHSRGAKEAIGGDALAFGQVRGKFVVTPDWDEVLG